MDSDARSLTWTGSDSAQSSATGEGVIAWRRRSGTNRVGARGYPIEQLALKSSHLETAYLLIYGSLPTKEQYRFFESEVMRHSVMHSDAEGFFRSFRFVRHPGRDRLLPRVLILPYQIRCAPYEHAHERLRYAWFVLQ